MIAGLQIRKAIPEDYDGVVNLLASQKLPVEDIEKKLPHFFVVKELTTIAGVIGMEVYGGYGLLRSMATNPIHRNRGIASALVNELVEYARLSGIKEIYLLTETAESFFAKKGFITVERNKVPLPLQQSKEFSHLCPTSATVLKKEI